MQVIKVPGLDGSGKTKRTRDAGNAIISELANSELLDLEEIHVDNSNLVEQDELLFNNSKDALNNKDKVVFLGGDSSISFPISRAFMNVFPEYFLILFSSHVNDSVRKLIESGWDTSNIVIVGLRNLNNKERIFLEENKIRYYEMKNIESKEDLCDVIMEASHGQNLQVSFDINVVDPAFAPGTLDLEPGGFTSFEILYFARRISMMRNLRAVDIFDVFSDDLMTVKLASRILQNFM